jgi:hypothetical protein
MTRHEKNIMAAIFACVSLLCAGYGIGTGAGRSMLTGIISLRGPLMPLLYMPARHYYESARLLNSRDELDRAAGYYSLLEGTVPEEAYVRELYQKESSDSCRKILLWVISHSGADLPAFNILRELYEKSGDDMKSHILRAMSGADRERYDAFIKEKGLSDAARPEMNPEGLTDPGGA